MEVMYDKEKFMEIPIGVFKVIFMTWIYHLIDYVF